jgi:hypothetical protein
MTMKKYGFPVAMEIFRRLVPAPDVRSFKAVKTVLFLEGDGVRLVTKMFFPKIIQFVFPLLALILF